MYILVHGRTFDIQIMFVWEFDSLELKADYFLDYSLGLLTLDQMMSLKPTLYVG